LGLGLELGLGLGLARLAARRTLYHARLACGLQ
jgi:hypothetical protein